MQLNKDICLPVTVSFRVRVEMRIETHDWFCRADRLLRMIQ